MNTLTALGPETTVEFRPVVISGYQTGALDISMPARRVLSIPTQLGCWVGCTFCVSSLAPLVRSLTADEMLSMVRACLVLSPADRRPIELSFTGEGEALLNWRETAKVCSVLHELSRDFEAVRYCFSGIGATKLLERLWGGVYPMRLQFSLHSARQEVRDRLVPRSEPLSSILTALHAASHKFSAIELNVVLQDGINDSADDLAALLAWGDPAWPIVLNPLLGDGREAISPQSDKFAESLLHAGRRVLRYSKIGAQISRRRIYPLMSARPPVRMPENSKS